MSEEMMDEFEGLLSLLATACAGNNCDDRQEAKEALRAWVRSHCRTHEPQVERQAWPCRRNNRGTVLVACPDAAMQPLRPGDGWHGWTCVVFAFNAEDRDVALSGKAAFLDRFPVLEDGTPALWAIMVRRQA